MTFGTSLAKAEQTWLKDQFGKKFIDKDMWPPRSPDLNPCDFFFMGSSKVDGVQSFAKNIGLKRFLKIF